MLLVGATELRGVRALTAEELLVPGGSVPAATTRCPAAPPGLDSEKALPSGSEFWVGSETDQRQTPHRIPSIGEPRG
jgi:hypothetical protein